MKRLIDFAGGRGLVNDDLQTIQDSLDSLMAIYKAAGPFVVHGVIFSSAGGGNYNVSAGAVMLNNRLIEFPAQVINLASSKAIAQSTPVGVDSRQYVGIGVSKPGANEYGVVITSGTSPTQPGDNLFITTPSGGFLPQVRRMNHALQELIHVPGMIMAVNEEIASRFAGSFDLFGRDEWLGWRLRTAPPASFQPVDLRDNGLVGAGLSYSVGDNPELLATSGPTTLLSLYAVHFVEFFGTRSQLTTFI